MKKGATQPTKLQYSGQKSPIVEQSKLTSSKKSLTSAQGSETKEAKGLTKEGGTMGELSFKPLPTHSVLTTNQEGTTRMTIQPHSLTIELVANQWETIIPRTTDNLPAHIKGAAKWVDYNEPNRSCYVVQSPGNVAEEWPIELINGKWYLLTWENTGWRTKASRRLNDGDRKALNLGWFNITDAEHPDYHPLFAAPQGKEGEESVIVQGPSRDKGKGIAPRPLSTDIHSP